MFENSVMRVYHQTVNILRVYVDTSVIGGCFDKEFSEASNKLFRLFKEMKMKAIVSDITLLELQRAPRNVQEVVESLPDGSIEGAEITDEALELAEEYMKSIIVPEQSRNDAIHIAIATCLRVDIILSWNFKHIVNWNRIRKYNSVNLCLGYPAIDIRSPMEVVYEEGF